MLYGKIKLDMSLKTQYATQSLEITGNVLELPPVKDVTKPLERKSLPESPKKRQAQFISTSTISNINRAQTMASVSGSKRSDSNNTLTRQNTNNSENKELIKQL